MKRVAMGSAVLIFASILFFLWTRVYAPQPAPVAPPTLSPSPTLSRSRGAPAPDPTPSPTPTPSPSPTVASLPTPTAMPTPFFPQVKGNLTVAELSWLQDDETLITTLQDMLARVPPERAAYVHFLLGRTYVASARYAEAEREFAALLDGKARPPDVPAEVWLYRGRALAALGRGEDALRAYTTYARLPDAPLSAYAWVQAARLLRQQNRDEDALAAYQTALREASAGERVTWQLEWAEYLDALDRAEDALTQYGALLARADLSSAMRARVLLQRARLYLRQQATPQAVADLRAVLDIAAQTSGGTYPARVVPAAIPFAHQALVLLVDMGEAVDDYTRGVIDVEAGAYTPAVPVLIRYLDTVEPHHGDAHAYLARALAALGNMDGAFEQWQTLIDTHPECACWGDAWFSLEGLYRQTGQPAQARILLRRLLRDPRATSALKERARLALADGQLWQGNLEAAREAYLALAYDAQTPDTRNRAALLAAVLSLPGRPGEARQVLAYAHQFSIHPHWQPVLKYWLGKSALAEGDRTTAVRLWQELAATRPQSWYAFRAADQLRRLGEPVSPWQPTTVPFPTPEQSLPPTHGAAMRAWLARFPQNAVREMLLRAAAYADAGLDASAVALYRQAIARIDDAPAVAALGRTLQALGYPQLGIQAASRALTLEDATLATMPAEYWSLLYPMPARAYLFAVAERFDLDPALLLALIRQESHFAAQATSTANARGLMQLIPSTARYTAQALGLRLTHEDRLYTPRVNLQLGAYYLATTLQRFQGDVVAALAGYNAGPGNAAYWRRIFGDDDDRFLELVPILETRTYLRQVQRQRAIYRWLIQSLTR